MPRGSRNVKDTVFRAMFRQKGYVLQLYRALHPDDAPVADGEIKTITLENALAYREHNDVAFLVRGKLMILVEAQSSWSVNVLVRMLIYLLHEYYEYITSNHLNLFSKTPVELPVPHLFIIYTGSDKKDAPAELSLRRDFFGGAETSLDLTAKVIRDGAHGDIISQYVGFAHVFDEQVKIHGLTDRAIIETIRICKDLDLLREFLAAHEKEAYNAMQLFTEEFVENAIRQEGYDNGLSDGIASERKEVLEGLFRHVKDGSISVDVASSIVRLPVPAFQQRMAEYDAHPERD